MIACSAANNNNGTAVHVTGWIGIGIGIGKGKGVGIETETGNNNVTVIIEEETAIVTGIRNLLLNQTVCATVIATVNVPLPHPCAIVTVSAIAIVTESGVVLLTRPIPAHPVTVAIEIVH